MSVSYSYSIPSYQTGCSGETGNIGETGQNDNVSSPIVVIVEPPNYQVLLGPLPNQVKTAIIVEPPVYQVLLGPSPISSMGTMVLVA